MWILKFYKSIFFTRRFYWLFVAVIFLFITSYGLAFLFNLAQVALIAFCLVAVIDYIILFSRKNPVGASRDVSDQLSNSDQNKVSLHVTNRYPFKVNFRVIDETPIQFQMRNFSVHTVIPAGETIEIQYRVRPTERGEYVFRDLNVFMRSPLNLIVRRVIIRAEKKVKVLPSFFALRQYELLAYSNQLAEMGSRRIRKIGHSLEFEQIKDYVAGDDIRSINWKATGRRGGQLMVNKFTDEKSQQVYCLLDKGRVMKMPFDGLTLLDYAINATLILSRVALVKQDKAGLISFADQIGDFLPADHKSVQMSNVLETLYNQQTKFLETDYEKLHVLVRTRITQRSLLVLFTNFESLSALKRELPYIRSMARNHLVLVVFFENTPLEQLAKAEIKNIEDLYSKTIAEKFMYEKRLIVKELQRHGIATILTPPQQLTVKIVNKYLEIKARQAI
ncbi:MAG: DUF58 domain-containing protein [Bacteroidetes bacterium]|nr:MAG: DUF58 domain-containing protein [Bacteroidota bacterium]